MPKNIAFPTDTKLLDKSRQRLIKLASENEIELRQNYNRITKNLLRQIGGYLHAKQMKRAKKAQKKLKTIVGRVARDCKRKIAGDEKLERSSSPDFPRLCKRQINSTIFFQIK